MEELGGIPRDNSDGQDAFPRFVEIPLGGNPPPASNGGASDVADAGAEVEILESFAVVHSPELKQLARQADETAAKLAEAELQMEHDVPVNKGYIEALAQEILGLLNRIRGDDIALVPRRVMQSILRACQALVRVGLKLDRLVMVLSGVVLVIEYVLAQWDRVFRLIFRENKASTLRELMLASVAGPLAVGAATIGVITLRVLKHRLTALPSHVVHAEYSEVMDVVYDLIHVCVQDIERDIKWYASHVSVFGVLTGTPLALLGVRRYRKMYWPLLLQGGRLLAQVAKMVGDTAMVKKAGRLLGATERAQKLLHPLS